jgi:uridine kinase
VAVDGRAGSGKSTFAQCLSKALAGAPILPLDDFLSWDDLTEFWPRLEADVLLPLFQGRDARYQARDWQHDPYGRGLGAWKDFPFAPLVILEGVGSARMELRSRLAYAIWVDTPPQVCLERGISRDGIDRASLWVEWQQREAAFFESDPVRSRVHLIVNGQRRFED